MLKFQIPNHKFQINTNDRNHNGQTVKIRNYDLAERTYLFAKSITIFCKKLPKNISNIEYAKQVIKSSGSVGANYIEANEALSKKDFILRIKICRKEAKESAYWLKLIIETNSNDIYQEGLSLNKESIELKKIFSSILR